MSLRQLLGYDIDKITVWTQTESGTDEYGRPVKTWEKAVYMGKWEHAINLVRSMTGDEVTTTGNVCLPVLLDITEETRLERGESTSTEPSQTAREPLSFEEINELGKQPTEWIYYV